MADKILDASEISFIVQILEQEIDVTTGMIDHAKANKQENRLKRFSTYLVKLTDIVKKLKS